jgi:hypothetical protein
VTARSWRHSSAPDVEHKKNRMSIIIVCAYERRMELIRSMVGESDGHAMANPADRDLFSESEVAFFATSCFLLVPLKLSRWASEASCLCGGLAMEQLRRRCTSLDLSGFRMKSSAPAVKHLLFIETKVWWWGCG